MATTDPRQHFRRCAGGRRRDATTIPTDGHPPGTYRMAAPAQHERGFFDAFGIRAGDRMWLDPNDRVSIW